MEKMDRKYGKAPLHARYLTDRAERLAIAELKKLREELHVFTKKFPQLLFSIFITELPPGGQVSEFVFWLANRAQFSPTEARGADNFDILLVLDPATKTAALTIGYGLEETLSEGDLQRALEAAERSWLEGDLAGGLHACIDWLTHKLRDLSLARAT